MFLSAVYSSGCVCGACGCVALKRRSSYSAIIHLVQRRAAAAQPCWLWAFGLLATTADRPQLTLAHTATFHPGRGGEEDREGKRNREVENVGDGAMSRGGTRRERRSFWWFCPMSKWHFLFVREKHLRWRMEGVFQFLLKSRALKRRERGNSYLKKLKQVDGTLGDDTQWEDGVWGGHWERLVSLSHGFHKAEVCVWLPGEQGTYATLIFAHSSDVLCGVYLW